MPTGIFGIFGVPIGILRSTPSCFCSFLCAYGLFHKKGFASDGVFALVFLEPFKHCICDGVLQLRLVAVDEPLEQLVEDWREAFYRNGFQANQVFPRNGEDVAAAVRQIRKSEARARRAAKDGLEPDSSLLSEIARGKSELLEKIRAERWK